MNKHDNALIVKQIIFVTIAQLYVNNFNKFLFQNLKNKCESSNVKCDIWEGVGQEKGKKKHETKG